jgi:hypothetical protein
LTILEYVQHDNRKNGVKYSSKGIIAVLAVLIDSAYSFDVSTGKGDPVVVHDDIRKYISEPDQRFYVSLVTQGIPDTCIFTWIDKAFVANSGLLFNKKNNGKLSSAFTHLRQEQKKCLVENMPIDDESPSTLIKVRKILISAADGVMSDNEEEKTFDKHAFSL